MAKMTKTAVKFGAGLHYESYRAGYKQGVADAELASADLFWQAFHAGYEQGFAHGEGHARNPDQPIGTMGASAKAAS